MTTSAGASCATAQIWDPVAGNWDRAAEFVEQQKARATERLLALAEIHAGDALLDLATGPGGAGLAALPYVGDAGSVVLSDGSAPMVEIAERRTAQIPNVSTRLLDLSDIDVPDASFDVTLCRMGLMFMPDHERAAAEMTRVLRPGGRAAVAVWGPREANPWLGLLLDSLSAQFGGAPFPPPGVPGPFSLGDPEQLGGLLNGAGLTDVRVEEVPAPMRQPSAEAWWETVPQLAGPLSIALAGMEPEVRDEIRSRAIAAVRAAATEEPDGAIAIDSVILVAAGRRAA